LTAPIGDLIRSAEAGAGEGAEALFALLYQELHRLAEAQLRRRGSDLTLGATTLLHEAYLSIARREGIEFPDRHRFLAYASRAMRGLVIDYARRRRAAKRGAEFHITGSAVEEAAAAPLPAELEALSDALDALALADPALAQLVDLHFFGGFDLREIAAMRRVSERTVQRDWRKARLLLFHHLRDDAAPA
jgi:RNA polymerase sigma factor (TIGR02999 family)